MPFRALVVGGETFGGYFVRRVTLAVEMPPRIPRMAIKEMLLNSSFVVELVGNKL